MSLENTNNINIENKIKVNIFDLFNKIKANTYLEDYTIFKLYFTLLDLNDNEEIIEFISKLLKENPEHKIKTINEFHNVDNFFGLDGLYEPGSIHNCCIDNFLEINVLNNLNNTFENNDDVMDLDILLKLYLDTLNDNLYGEDELEEVFEELFDENRLPELQLRPARFFVKSNNEKLYITNYSLLTKSILMGWHSTTATECGYSKQILKLATKQNLLTYMLEGKNNWNVWFIKKDDEKQFLEVMANKETIKLV